MNKKLNFFILYRSHFGSSVRQSISGRKSFWFVVMNCNKVTSSEPRRYIFNETETHEDAQIPRSQDFLPWIKGIFNKFDIRCDFNRKIDPRTLTAEQVVVEEKTMEGEIEMIQDDYRTLGSTVEQVEIVEKTMEGKIEILQEDEDVEIKKIKEDEFFRKIPEKKVMIGEIEVIEERVVDIKVINKQDFIRMMTDKKILIVEEKKDWHKKKMVIEMIDKKTVYV